MKDLETLLKIIEAAIHVMARTAQLLKPVILEILLLIVLIVEAVRFLISVIGG